MNEFAWFRDHHVENMERMFAAVSDLYAELWNDFFHFAIHEGGEDRETAFRHTHERYRAALRVTQGSTVLELACGRGGFASFLAESGADVLGLDISRAQLRHARRYERANLHFLQHDIMKVDELDRTFDAVVLMDADVYLPDKALAIRRIGRVLKPGARFLFIPWCMREGLNPLQQELVLHPFMRYWGIPDLETPSAYRQHLQRAGLQILEEEDLNERVRPNWDFAYEAAIAAVQRLTLVEAAKFAWSGLGGGTEALRLIKEQFPAALYIKAAFDAGFLRYTYLLAEKPASS